MKIFQFDPSDHAEHYRTHDWVHIREGLHPEFLGALREFTATSLEQTKIEGVGIGGQKEQSLFEFPESVDYPSELFDAVAAVAGLERSRMTISERHIKAYDHDAAPDFIPHKDRVASQVSVGLSIRIPAESQLVLYPFEHRGVNPFNVSWALRNSLQSEELPEVALKEAREVLIDDGDGDVIMFAGSSMWHYRRNAANAVNLYLKFNDFHCDPLGEDTATPERRSRTLAALDGKGRDGLARLVPVVGRRLDSISRVHTRDNWNEVLQATLWSDEPFGLTPSQFELLHEVDGTRTFGELAAALARDGSTAADVEADVSRLAEKGALDLE